LKGCIDVSGEKLKADMLRLFKPVISSWMEPDIYVISFFIYDNGDNPCEPVVTIGYNTERQYEKSIANAYDNKEARWNFAFWLHNAETAYGGEFAYGEDDTKEDVAHWIRSNGLPYYPSFDDIPADLDDESLGELQVRITAEFVDILVEVIQELHKTGFIQEIFGKPIPIIVHELEYYDQIADQNVKANSMELVKDFVTWIHSM
jgi:hypothetical protein